jgi:hypothetical protein
MPTRYTTEMGRLRSLEVTVRAARYRGAARRAGADERGARPGSTRAAVGAQRRSSDSIPSRDGMPSRAPATVTASAAPASA